jgi:hypothetical protein
LLIDRRHQALLARRVAYDLWRKDTQERSTAPDLELDRHSSQEQRHPSGYGLEL